jgi:hypothetical protein
MTDSTDPALADDRVQRRRIATRRLADATGIGCATVRRPASTDHDPREHRLVESTI